MNQSNHPLAGVYAASVTPLHADFSPDHESLPELLKFLQQRGCHGVLLFGTTGEGPSFSPQERLALLQTALDQRPHLPGLRILFGAGTPSLDETIFLCRSAFDMGVDGVVVLPPYYFRKVAEDGLFEWFSLVLQRAVPTDGAFLGYHIPPVTGVPLSLDLLSRLKDAFPRSFAGIKDSSGDAQHASQLGARFGADLLVFNGSDKLFSLALEAGAAGCITAMANLCSPTLRQLWQAYQAGQQEPTLQEKLNTCRAVMDNYAPFPRFVKALLAARHGFPVWHVCPPLLPLSSEPLAQALAEWDAACGA